MLHSEELIDIESRIQPGHSGHYDIHIARLPTGSVVDIRMFIYRGHEPGPVLLLSGGLHGDEVNGVEIIRRMIARQMLQPVAGTILAMPVLNVYGFLNFNRDLPDGKDANRSFPGTRNGSLASRVAWHLTHRILPLIDYGLDFHTGGANRANYPQVRCDWADERSLALAQAFAPPFLLHSGLIPHSLRHEAHNMDKRIIVYEGGQSLRFDEFAIREGIAGIQRVMAWLGMIDAKEAHASPWHTKQLGRTTWVRAEVSGLFESAVTNGQKVRAGQRLGVISNPFNDYCSELRANEEAYVIGMNYSPVIHAGDALFHLALER